ncbi:MAG: insulinase family protein [Ignavibacteriaceae bacterium]|nr:insulinase family protein [Ignavibacteriaceae bacterium]
MKTINILVALFILLVHIPTNGNSMSNDKVILKINKENPIISIKVWFKVGSQDDPKGKEGLSYLTASMLTQGGTAKNTFASMTEKLFPLASYYSARPSVEMTIFEGKTHKDNFDEFVSLFNEQITEPGFREEDFTRLKNDALNYIETTLRYSSDEELGKAVLYNTIFNGTPYGHILQGTISGLKSITLEDVKNFYSTYFNRENYVVAITGDLSQAQVSKITDALEKLNPGKENTPPAIKAEKIEGINVVIIEKQANATAISMGYPIDLVRGNREWYALSIANSWLGEHRNSSSHLYQIIREERGLNYGDYSYIENFPNGGRFQMPNPNAPKRHQIFEIWIRPVPNETKHFAFRAAIREFEKLLKNGMTDDTYSATRSFLRNYVLNYAPTEDARLGYMIDDKFYNIPAPGHIETFRNLMSKISLAEVNDAIKKNFQSENMVIVFITPDAEALKNALVNNESSPIVYSSPKSDFILEEDKEIINYPIKIKAENIKIVKVDELFN